MYDGRAAGLQVSQCEPGMERLKAVAVETGDPRTATLATLGRSLLFVGVLPTQAWIATGDVNSSVCRTLVACRQKILRYLRLRSCS